MSLALRASRSNGLRSTLGITYRYRPWAQRLFAAPIVTSTVPQNHETTTHGRLCSHWPIRHQQQQPKGKGQGHGRRKCQDKSERRRDGLDSFVRGGWLCCRRTKCRRRGRAPPHRDWPATNSMAVWVDAESFFLPQFWMLPRRVSRLPQQQDRRRESSNQSPPRPHLPIGSRTDAGCTVQSDESVPSRSRACTCTRTQPNETLRPRSVVPA